MHNKRGRDILFSEGRVKYLEKGEKRSAFYRRIRCMDENSGQRVWLVLYLPTGELRVMKKAGDSQKEAAALRLWASLKHPGLSQIYDILTEEDGIYCVMEYIPGKTLRAFVEEYREKNRAIPVSTAAKWGIELCRILAYLHSREPAVIYQDLKPSNIIISEGHLKLIDPDSVCLAEKYCRIVGTPGFLAPEQQREDGILDGRTDVYALGCLLSWMIGEKKKYFPNGTWLLHQIAARCKRTEKKERFQNCQELEMALRRVKNFRARLLGLCLCLFVGVMGGGKTCAWIKEKRDKEKTYQFYLDQKNISDYQSAIFLFPVREEGYQKLLDHFIEDGELDREEHRQLVFVLRETESSFRENTEAYGRFSYRLGMLYWFQYAEKGGRRYAKNWLEKFLESTKKEYETEQEEGEERERQRVRAEVLCVIAETCDILEYGDPEGDMTVDYEKFWEESVRLLEMPLAQEDNLTTALRFWNELAGFFYQCQEEFREAGVPKKEWRQQIESLEEKLTFAKQKEDFGIIEEKLKEELRKKLELLNEKCE